MAKYGRTAGRRHHLEVPWQIDTLTCLKWMTCSLTTSSDNRQLIDTLLSPHYFVTITSFKREYNYTVSIHSPINQHVDAGEQDFGRSKSEFYTPWAHVTNIARIFDIRNHSWSDIRCGWICGALNGNPVGHRWASKKFRNIVWSNTFTVATSNNWKSQH